MAPLRFIREVRPFLVLDSGPLGLLTHPQRSVEVISLTDQLSRWLLKDARVLVPAIVYYELKRELLRARKAQGIERLDAFIAAAPGRYLPLSDQALRLGAELSLVSPADQHQIQGTSTSTF